MTNAAEVTSALDPAGLLQIYRQRAIKVQARVDTLTGPTRMTGLPFLRNGYPYLMAISRPDP
jgi:hypothetical protein